MSDRFHALKEKNPAVAFYTVADPEFAEYGRVIDGVDAGALCSVARGMEFPQNGSRYLPSVAALERLPAAAHIQTHLFGTLPIEVGYCFGYNRMLNALEWHSSSEINIAVTPLVLFLAKRSELQSGRLNSSVVRAFYVPQGTVIEVYATSLHFCPCQISDEGFGCIVALPKGTNLPLEQTATDRYLYRKNKWLIAHEWNTALLEKGVPAGITGRNPEVRYPEKSS